MAVRRRCVQLVHRDDGGSGGGGGGGSRRRFIAVSHGRLVHARHATYLRAAAGPPELTAEGGTIVTDPRASRSVRENGALAAADRCRFLASALFPFRESDPSACRTPFLRVITLLPNILVFFFLSLTHGREWHDKARSGSVYRAPSIAWESWILCRVVSCPDLSGVFCDRICIFFASLVSDNRDKPRLNPTCKPSA